MSEPVLDQQAMDETMVNPLLKLNKDIKAASTKLNSGNIRFLVDLYYQMQRHRIMSAAQLRQQDSEPNKLIELMAKNSHIFENIIKNALGHFASSLRVGAWLQSICGIGPVISAGLLAEIDIRKARHASQVWAFAGLVSTRKWNKGEKRPWNARLKTLTVFKLGECFIKVQNNKKDFYGKIFATRRALEQQRNDSGEYAEEAAKILQNKKYNKDTDAYKAYITGKLPPAHLKARARRYAVKLFLSHLHQVMHEDYYGTKPDVPYIIANDPAHTHFINPPNYPLTVEGIPLKTFYDRPVTIIPKIKEDEEFDVDEQ